MVSRSVLKKSANVNKTSVIKFIVCFACAFFVSLTSFGLMKSPFAISFAGALPPVFSIAVMAGSIFSYMLFPDVYTLPFALAVVAMVVLKCSSLKVTPFKNAVMATLCTLLSYMVDFILYGFDYRILFNYFYVVSVSGIVTYYLTVLFGSTKDIRAVIASDKYVAATVYFILIAVCSSFSVAGLNIGRIIAVVVILSYSRNYRCAGGAISGALVSVTLLMCGAGNLHATVFLGVSGIASGIFMRYKRGTAAAAFLIVNILSGAVAGYSMSDIVSYIDIVIGAVIFCFIPVEKIHDEENHISCCSDMDGELQRFASFRMRAMADALSKAGENMFAGDIKQTVMYSSEGNIRTVYNYVCKECSGKNYCWGCRNSTTYEVFSKVASNKNISLSDIPEEFDYCFRTDEIIYEFRNMINNQLVDITAAGCIRVSRNVFNEQLRTSAEIIKGISADVVCGFVPDKRITERTKKCLIENDIGFNSVAAYYNGSKRLVIEVYCSKNAFINGYRIYKVLGEEFEKSFDCVKNYDNDEMRFLITERPKYNVETYISQKSMNEGEPNGDTCDCFKDDSGNVYLVISDGAGTGKNASEYSKATVRQVKELILSGVGTEESVKIVNSAMIMQGKEDFSATMDIAKINLDSGNVTLYKSGAGATMFRRNSSVSSVTAQTFPLGVSGNAECYSRCFSLKVNDMVALFSDGVPEEVYTIAKKEMMDSRKDVSDISGNICNVAQKVSNDDVSVIVAKIISQKA